MEDNVKKGPSALVLPTLLLVVLLILLFIFLKSCGPYFKSSENPQNNQPGITLSNGGGSAAIHAAPADSTAAVKDTTAAVKAPADTASKH